MSSFIVGFERFLALEILIFSKFRALFIMSLPWWDLMVLKRESIQVAGIFIFVEEPVNNFETNILD